MMQTTLFLKTFFTEGLRIVSSFFKIFLNFFYFIFFEFFEFQISVTVRFLKPDRTEKIGNRDFWAVTDAFENRGRAMSIHMPKSRPRHG